MTWIKWLFKTFFYLVFVTISAGILLEVIFRNLPVSDSLKVKPVNSKDPILRFESNRTVRKQIGFDFSHINIKNINNFGFASDRDFDSLNTKDDLILAIIGDSYVEALQVKNSETFHAKIDKKLPDLKVYPIGVSGSALSQYIAYTKYIKSEFDPEFYVFLIINNDFNQSWYEKTKTPGFHYFTREGTLELIDYVPSKIKVLARESAFLRYLHLDLKLAIQLSRFINSEKSLKQNKPIIEKEILNNGKTVIDFFLEGISRHISDKNVILMLDGNRRAIYDGAIERDLNDPYTRRYFELIEKSKVYPNIQILDLHPIFQSDWSSNKILFNYEYDLHWNEHGHNIAAKALIEKLGEYKE